MPAALQRKCARSGCNTLTTGHFCPDCQRQKHQQRDDRRGSATSRGYGRRWDAYRKWFLHRFPRCGDRPKGAPKTSDSRCRAQGLIVAATVVDHIVPVTGPNDPTFYKPACHQALCARCHDSKRGREGHAARKAG